MKSYVIKSKAGEKKKDLVEVVRCKDCAHCVKRKFDNVTEYECGVFDIFVDLQEYCCKGERKAE